MKGIHNSNSSTVIPKKRFQIAVIIILVMLLFLDIFIANASIVVSWGGICFGLAQIYLSLVFLLCSYPDLCVGFREQKRCKTTDNKFSLPLPLFMSNLFSFLPLIGSIYLYGISIWLPSVIGTICVEKESMIFSYIAVVILADIFVFVFTSLWKNYTGLEEESQYPQLQVFNGMSAIKRTSFLKRILQGTFIISLFLCLCSSYVQNFYHWLGSVGYFPNFLVLGVNFYYTVLNITGLQKDFTTYSGKFTCFSSKEPKILMYVKTFFLLILFTLCYFQMYLSCCFYFLTVAINIGFALGLNKFGKYPFIDYELQLPEQ